METSKKHKQVVVRCEVEPKFIDEYLTLAEIFTPQVRWEKGNIFFTLLRSSQADNVFIFLGVWEDQEALQAHMDSDHFHNFVPHLGEHVLSMQTDICDIAI
ncbi:MAG: putative quinol monooxygenase [Brevinema sp.]